MAFFEHAAPDIYQQYANYQPKDLVLQEDASGDLNLVNVKADNHPVYKGQAKAFCQKQVADFIQRPKVTSIKYSPAPITNKKHIHAPLINSLIEKAQEYEEKVRPHCDVPIGTLIISGCGLGYHIYYLLQKLDVYNLVIYDAHKDSFYASLYVIDWAPIVRFLSQNGRSLQLMVGVEPKDAMLALKNHVKNIGLHNVVYTFFFSHLHSEPAQHFISLYRKEFHLNALGIGFFDDEQVGLAHTVNNLYHRVKVFREDVSDKNLPPVFVIANGPSLDDHVQYLKKHCKHAIIISCGTAIASLAKAGVKPDFHVEMERNINIKEWIEHGTTADFRKGITLLCLNTAAPEVLGLFDDYCMAKKPNDIGEYLIDCSVGGEKIEPLHLCNPTVANAGLSFSLAMGFKQVYLFGVDLGIQKTGQHHSKLSIYYDLERITQTKGHSEFEDERNNYFIRANFGGEISTNTYLDSTRLNLEILLRYYHRICNDVRCYNPNDGAFIDGTLPIRQENITLPSQSVDKPLVVQMIKNTHFTSVDKDAVNPKLFVKNNLKQFFDIKDALKLDEEVNTPFDIYHRLSQVFMKVHSQTNDPVVQHLLLGSINEYFAMIMKVTMFQRDKAQLQETYRVGYHAYITFLKRAYEFMEERPLELDDTYDNIGEKFSSGSKSEVATD